MPQKKRTVIANSGKSNPMSGFGMAPDPRGVFVAALHELGQLERNWNGYGAPPPNEWALNKASEVIDSFLGRNLRPTKVAPSGKGGIAICFTQKRKFAEIQCSNSERMFVMTSDPHGTPEMEVREIDANNFHAGIAQIKAFTER